MSVGASLEVELAERALVEAVLDGKIDGPQAQRVRRAHARLREEKRAAAPVQQAATPPVEPCLSVACPVCGAPAGEMCRDASASTGIPHIPGIEHIGRHKLYAVAAAAAAREPGR